MRSETDLIQSLERNVNKLLEQYQFLKSENELLLNNNFALQQQNKSLAQQVDFYQEELAVLKIAKTLQGSEEYKKDTKTKIDVLVAEIEECIEKLNT